MKHIMNVEYTDTKGRADTLIIDEDAIVGLVKDALEQDRSIQELIEDYILAEAYSRGRTVKTINDIRIFRYVIR